MRKVMAIASAGGHWIQLLRLAPAFSKEKLIFVSTKDDFGKMVKEYEFFKVHDSNRSSKVNILKSLVSVSKLVFKIKPDVIVTTGAAPGLMAVLVGKIIGAKTVWIDSIANVEEVSLSGKIALKIADRVYTQWPDLANGKVLYAGNIL